ncbi:MAG: c-type cytochrome [Campylobacterales bacterium]|nr:c-type cytochrome [Campylobacterales bacterium]
MKRWMMTLGLLASVSLMAADGAALYQKCISCHGASAEKKALGKSEVIANWSVEKNVAALKGYKDGTYGGPMKALMKGQIATYSDAEIQAVSEYVVGLKN